MATPTSILDLPALLVLDKDDLGASGCAKETNKFDAPITDNLSLEQRSKIVGDGIQSNLEAKNDAVEGEICPIQELEDPKKQGLKPSRGEDMKSSEFKPSRFKEDLEKGIPVESDDHRIKRSVFGFGLSGDQENALFQYITNKSGNMPYHEPDCEALAHCWGSPEPVREVDNNESEEDDIPVAFPADLSETLSVKEMVKSGLPATSVVAVNGENEGLFQADEERLIDAENEVDAASTESLYEGEGGADQGFKSVTVDSLANIEDEEKHEDPAQVLDNEQMERDLIMQKVKECYGFRVKTSLERAMRKGDSESIISSQGLDNQFHTVKSGASPDAAFSGTRKDDMVSSPTTAEVPENGSFINLWEDECMTYLERTPEFRARLQYQVRVILISPAFHVAGRTVTAFSSFYEKKFGRTDEAAGFSTSARLCRSMPHVVQRSLLIDEGKLQLVDTPKNHRIVAGIRSGLRRIVYDILKTHQGMDLDTIESLCERVIGQPLHEVLIDHGYHTASVECMLHDMPDIAHLDEHAERTRVYLCKGAEDPALTDGFLLRQSSQERSFVGLAGSKSQFNREVSSCNSDLLVEENQQSPDDDDADERWLLSPDCSRTGPIGMAPEELSDLRALCAAESNNLGRDASIYNVEDLSPHVRLRLRLLLALHDEGRGIEVECLPSVYEKMFAVPLDLPTLGFNSLQELIDAWQDVMLTQTSNPRWVFPINTLDNNRVLNTITSGLRSAVFAILLARYPAGLEPLELVECLEETLSGKIWEILSSNGYIFKDLIKTGKSLSRSPSEFQLPDCPELRLLLKDMEDFVRLGCREDGVLIVKLRDGEFPLLDLQDCDVSGGFPEGEEEKSSHSSDVDAIKETLNPTASSLSSPAKPDGHVEMAMDIQLPARINNEALKAEHEVAEEGGAVDWDLTPLDMMSSEEQNPASLPTSPTLNAELVVTVQEQSCNPSHKLKHETRMILGSPDYMENGLTIEEFRTVYKDRTGGPLSLGEFKLIESLLHAMPDIVSFELGPAPDDQIITLVQSRRNMRILSVAMVGLRQVLFWALLRNPGGVWAELLEGWFLDFTGWPLSCVLASHGYEKTRRAPLQPVTEFLQDMADIVEMNENDPSLYCWAGLCEGPNLADALLLGVSEENIQYDPVKAKNVNSRWQTGVVSKTATHLSHKDGKTGAGIKIPIGEVDAEHNELKQRL